MDNCSCDRRHPEKALPVHLHCLPPGWSKYQKEDVLQALLKGSGQTVEEFLRANRAKIQIGREFQKRANAAKWSRLWLAASTLFCLIPLISGRDFEDAISVLLLGAMTCMEFKVRDWFLKGDSRAAVFGYWNQTLFAGLFLIDAPITILPLPHRKSLRT